MTTTEVSMRYYAIEWTPYGVASNVDGSRCATYRQFDSRAERDAWVRESAGVPRTQDGYRESLSASDRELRRLLARDRRGDFGHGGPNVKTAADAEAGR